MPAERRRELWLEPLPAAELAGRLRGLPLFASVSVDELFRMAGTSRQVRHQPGTVPAPGRGRAGNHSHPARRTGHVSGESRRCHRPSTHPRRSASCTRCRACRSGRSMRTIDTAVTLAIRRTSCGRCSRTTRTWCGGCSATLAERVDAGDGIQPAVDGCRRRARAARGARLCCRSKRSSRCSVCRSSRGSRPTRCGRSPTLPQTVTMTVGLSALHRIGAAALWLILSGEVSVERHRRRSAHGARG